MITMPKNTQYELIEKIKSKEINIKDLGYDDLAKAIEKNYVFNEQNFEDCALILNLSRDEVFGAEEISDISFRGEGSEKEIKNTLTLFSYMIEQRKLRGGVNA